MKTLLFVVVLSVSFLWSETILAQGISNQTQSMKIQTSANAVKADAGLVLQTSKIMQKPETEDVASENKIKVVVTIPGEKITAVVEPRDESKKGGDDEK